MPIRTGAKAMAASEHREEERLVAGVRSGDAVAQERFLALAAKTIWPVAVALAGDGPAGEEAYLAVISALHADGFARLGRYDGGSELSSFLRLVARDVLGARVASGFSLNPDRAWRDFSLLFKRDIEKRIREHFPRDAGRWDDIYQDVSLRLLEDDHRRIRAYQGKESFVGFIVVTVNNLLIDLMRRETGRRRLPVVVSRLPAWQQLVFKYAAWKGVGRDPDRITEALKGQIDPMPSRARIAALLDELAAAIDKVRADEAGGREISGDTPDGKQVIEAIAGSSPDPLDALLQEEQGRLQARLQRHIETEKDKLSAREQMYLSLTWRVAEPMPPRTIARAMGLPVGDVYVLKERLKRWEDRLRHDLQEMMARPSAPGRSAN
jgi:RNA polymerase primary sigma factor